MKNKDGHYVCLWHAARGKCVAGDNCKWVHDDDFAAKLTEKQKSHIVQEQDRQQKVRKYEQEKKANPKAKANAKAKEKAKAKPDPKGKAKAAAAAAPGKVDVTKLTAEEKAKIPCVFWGTPKGCTRATCPFYHNPKLKSKNGVACPVADKPIGAR